MRRRTLLAGLLGGTLSLGGCLAGPTDAPTETGTPRTTAPSDTPTDTPAGCPTSQDLDVDRPDALDATTVTAFLEAYEGAYYREVVVDYEPASSLDSYGLAGGVTDGPTDLGDGWAATVSGSGGVYRPTLLLGATTATPPADADVVPASDVDDDVLSDLLATAADTGEAEHHVDTPGETVDRYVDLLAALSEDFAALSGPGDEDSLYADVGGTTVELTAQATNFHGDHAWTVRYYVDERVVRRATDPEADPREGELLECRPTA